MRLKYEAEFAVRLSAATFRQVGASRQEQLRWRQVCASMKLLRQAKRFALDALLQQARSHEEMETRLWLGHQTPMRS